MHRFCTMQNVSMHKFIFFIYFVNFVGTTQTSAWFCYFLLQQCGQNVAWLKQWYMACCNISCCIHFGHRTLDAYCQCNVAAINGQHKQNGPRKWRIKKNLCSRRNLAFGSWRLCDNLMPCAKGNPSLHFYFQQLWAFVRTTINGDCVLCSKQCAN